jgi:imidazolonepropionase-like amidohydrolase
MRWTIALTFLFCATSATAEQVWRYSVVFSGKTNGTQTTTAGTDGRIVVDYTYRNNGRGPDLHEETVLTTDGTQVTYSAKGKSTFGAPIAEEFTRAGERGSWQTLAGQGVMDARQPAAYVPESILSECSPESVAILTRAVLRAPSNSLPALPGGTLSAEKLKESTVESVNGSIDVSLYALHGLTTHPVLVWLNSDDSHRLFASISPGNRQIVLAGSESHADELEKLQIEAENELLAAIAKRVTHQFPEPFVFRNVRVFDSSSGTRSDPCDVYVARGRIAAIYPAGSKPQEAGATVDGAGQTLMPGLFDMHAHEDAWNSLLQIAGGVTTARDMGNDNPYLAQLMTRIETGELVGPRIVPCGFIEGRSPFSARNGKIVDSLQAAKDAVDWYAQRGYRQIKIYNSFHPDWLAATAAHAHARGLRVSGHVPAFMKAEQAVEAGYDEIQHINQVLLNFVVGPNDDTRTLARFTLVANKIHALDLESPEVRQFINRLKEHNVAIDATAAVFEANFTQMQGEPNPSYGVVEAHVPVALRRQWLVNSMDLNVSNADTWRASYAKMLSFIALMHREGVPLVAGTDDIAGFTLHRELELYAKAGIPATDVLRIATHNGAKFAGTLDSAGAVEPHRWADLVLVAGDPTSNISDIRRISLVMKNGCVYFPAEIYEAVGVQRFMDPPTVTITK